MAAAQLFLPASRAFNSNGLPVAGAVLKLYTTGTLIPQPIYSDSALTISLGSSVTANAAGRFQTVYQDNATAFRLRIEDATGAELDDIDPYYFGTMLFSATFSELASFTTRALLAAVSAPTDKQVAYLTEAGREGGFVFSTANLSAKVTADTLQGLYVAPSADTTGASGAWVRKFTGVSPHVNWWGFTADYNGTTGTDNLAVVNAAMVALQAITPPETEVGAVWFEGRSLSFRDAGRGYMSGPISIKTTLTEIDFVGSELIFPANSFGIIINTDTTDGESTRTSGPFPYRIRLIKPKLRGHNGTDRTKHAIWMRATATIIDPDIQNFSGDMIRIGNSNGHTAGNQNGWLVLNPFGQECGGDGIHAEGADASAGLCLNYNIALMGRFAVVDLSAAGNKWNGQAADCGVVNASVNTVPAFVYHAGTGHNWAIVAGQEANTTVTPSTARPDVWIDLGAGSGTDPAIPNWASGITMEAGGDLKTAGGTGAVQFDHCYNETGPYSVWQLSDNTIVRDPIGSTLGIGGTVEYPTSHGVENTAGFVAKITTSVGTSSAQLGGKGIGGLDTFSKFTDHNGKTWVVQASRGFLEIFDGQSGEAAFAVSLSGSGINFGRSSDQDGVAFFRYLALGYSNAGRIVDMNSAAPTTGYHAAGEIVFNNAPTSGGFVGWVCTAAGTPGTWKTFGAIS